MWGDTHRVRVRGVRGYVIRERRREGSDQRECVMVERERESKGEWLVADMVSIIKALRARTHIRH